MADEPIQDVQDEAAPPQTNPDMVDVVISVPKDQMETVSTVLASLTESFVEAATSSAEQDQVNQQEIINSEADSLEQDIVGSSQNRV